MLLKAIDKDIQIDQKVLKRTQWTCKNVARGRNHSFRYSLRAADASGTKFLLQGNNTISRPESGLTSRGSRC